MTPTRIVAAIDALFFECTPSSFLNEFKVQWVIEVKKPGWCTSVDVCIEIKPRMMDSDRNIHVHVFAHAHQKERAAGDTRSIFYASFFGSAKPEQITREWINTFLPREIETALVAAHGFTEADLQKQFPYRDAEFYQGMAGYFQSTLEAART